MPTDVFISYTRADLEITDAIARSLEALGLKIWWDSRLLPEDDVDRVIHRVLAETKVVVAVLSPSSIASDWVMWELSQARRNGLRLVAVLVGGVRPRDLPPSLDSIPALVLGDDDGGASRAVIADRIRDLVERSQGSEGESADPVDRDARRRLAIAAAETARHPPPVTAPPGGASDPAAAIDPPPNRRQRVSPASWSMSQGLPAFLARHDLALAFTSPQSGALYLLARAADGGLVVHEHKFRQAMGLDRAGDSLVLATLAHLYRLEVGAAPGRAIAEGPVGVPSTADGRFVGALDIHDVGVDGSGEVVFVNTRFNCLATAVEKRGFEPIWVPFFLAAASDGDRCHLNGLAMRYGAPAYATAAARSDEIDGWRRQRSGGGIVLDVQRNAIICEGLSMPHSPRIHGGELWVLNSGAGELGLVAGADRGGGRYRPIASCPGYTRGLAFHGDHAFVGLSRPRYDDFSGFELERRLADSGAEAWCGIQIIDTTSGEAGDWFRIDRHVGEIYGVAVLPGVTTAPRGRRSNASAAASLRTKSRPPARDA